MNWLLTVVRAIVGLYFFLYALIHVLIAVRPETANFLVFMNLIKWPFNDLTDPTKHGLHNVHNFYLETESDVKVGIWHFIPKPLSYDFETDSKRSLKAHFDNYFKIHDGRPIIIYVHGNDRDRAGRFRVGLCKRLNDLGYHIFAIDYRGYGDSTGSPSEEGVVKDIMVLYNFIKSFQNQSKVFIWGHSLGTGISTHASRVLSEFNSPPAGLILESPFKNISQAAKEYIIAPLILNNPWIIKKGDEALDHLNLRFNNAENIVHVNSKILIFHAADDWFIPQDRSRELLEICRKQRPANYPPVKLIELHEEHGLGHNNIYKHMEIYPIVKDFVESK